jgi:hypothetical protein
MVIGQVLAHAHGLRTLAREEKDNSRRWVCHIKNEVRS